MAASLTKRGHFMKVSLATGKIETIAAPIATVEKERRVAIQTARGKAAPDETTDTIYEMQLVQMAHDSAVMTQLRDRLAQN